RFQTQLAAQVEDGGLAVEEAVGSGLDAKARALGGVDLAARPGALLQDDCFEAGVALFEAEGQRQPRDTSADDCDLWHAASPEGPRTPEDPGPPGNPG